METTHDLAKFLDTITTCTSGLLVDGHSIEESVRIAIDVQRDTLNPPAFFALMEESGGENGIAYAVITQLAHREHKDIERNYTMHFLFDNWYRQNFDVRATSVEGAKDEIRRIFKSYASEIYVANIW